MEKLYFDYRKFKEFYREYKLKNGKTGRTNLWRTSHALIVCLKDNNKVFYDEGDVYIWENEDGIEQCFVTEQPKPLTEEE